MNYKDSLSDAMGMLAQHPQTLFVGQTVKYGGQAMWPTFKRVPEDRRIEFPVAEDLQLGFCTGLSLEGFIPICVYPRWDFLLLAANQLVNHLDKIPLIGHFRPKVIIRTAVGPKNPLNAGLQHTQDHTEAFRSMLKTVEIAQILSSNDAMPIYEKALKSEHSTIVVEYMERYEKNDTDCRIGWPFGQDTSQADSGCDRHFTQERIEPLVRS